MTCPKALPRKWMDLNLAFLALSGGFLGAAGRKDVGMDPILARAFDSSSEEV